MATSPIDAKVKKILNNSTNLLIKAGGVVVQAEFSELAKCEFLPRNGAPIPLQLSSNSTEDVIIGPFCHGASKAASGEYANTVKLPAYLSQDVCDLDAFQKLNEGSNADAVKQGAAKIPLVAIATSVEGQVDDCRCVQTHSALPVWNDGSTVLVTLDWCEGEPSEGMTSPEWHMRSSSGLPIEMGLEKLAEASKVSTDTKKCIHRIYVTPWLVGAQLLGNNGQPTANKVWQREWQFERFEDFSEALRRITDGLVGSESSVRPAVNNK